MLKVLAVIASLILIVTPAAIGKDTYYIGFAGNTTNAASIALSTVLQLTIEEYNSNTNNPYTLEMAFFDETLPGVADAIKNRSNLLGVTGALNTGMRAAMDSVQDTAFISCSSEYAGLNAGRAPNIFRMSASDTELASRTCRFLIGVSQKSKLASLWSEESDEYAAMAEAFHGTALRNKVWNQYHRSVDKDRKDFTAVLLKLRDDRVKNIYFAGPSWQAALLAKQASEMNVGADFSSTRLICNSQFVKNSKAGGQGAVFAMANPSTLYGVKKLRPFLNAYSARFQGSDANIPYLYDSAQLLIAALAAGKTSRQDVLAWVKSASYEGVTGQISFDAAGERVVSPVYFYIIRGKEFLQRNLRGSDEAGYNKTK